MRRPQIKRGPQVMRPAPEPLLCLSRQVRRERAPSLINRLWARPQPVHDAVRLAPALRGYFRRRHVAAQEIDDLIQEVFVDLQKRQSADAIDSLERYVFVVASHVLARHIDRQSRWTRAFNSDALETEGEISPERSAAARSDLKAAIDAINHMPRRTKQVFVLHRFEDMTYPRIAETLGISKSAVTKHMIRALKIINKLRED